MASSQESSQQNPNSGQRNQDATCSQPIDPTATAGTPGSLGSKSDCNGRPATDDTVVEAIDEAGPLQKPAPERKSA